MERLSSCLYWDNNPLKKNMKPELVSFKSCPQQPEFYIIIGGNLWSNISRFERMAHILVTIFEKYFWSFSMHHVHLIGFDEILPL